MRLSGKEESGTEAQQNFSKIKSRCKQTKETGMAGVTAGRVEQKIK